jgi:protein-tyrosine-phosphatase
MDAFVLPSLDEGVPMALLEAMALGVPVVATAVGGIPEIVAHRVTGLLVEAGDERALAAACLDLVLDPRWARTLGTGGRRIVEDAFSRERNGQAHVDAYRAVTAASIRQKEARGMLVRGARRIGAATVSLLERRRMGRIRRDPSALVAALRPAKRILVVCHGNIIRSPFAASLLARGLDEQRARVFVCSGGLEAVPGRPPHPRAVRAAATRGIDLRRHTAAQVTAETVAKADVILVMEVSHLVALRRRFPEARAKTFLLSCLAPEAPLEIEDPFGGDESRFEACFDALARAVTPLIRNLCAPARPVDAVDPGTLAVRGRTA